MSSQKVPTEPPSKFITTEVDVQLACRLFFVDMEGLNDGRAVKTIVPQVNPRKMVRSPSLHSAYVHDHILLLSDHRSCTIASDRRPH